MLLKLLKDKKFNSAINKFYQKYKAEVLDIILFGSVVRGKEKPNDIDVLLVFKDKEDLDAAYELRKSFAGLQVVTKTYTTLFNKNFAAREAYLGEGYSLIRKEFVTEGLGYVNLMLFKYELKGFSQSERMRLQYALYGRDRKSGIVKKLGLQKFADTVFFCPVEKAEELKEFLEHWKIKFMVFPMLIPKRRWQF